MINLFALIVVILILEKQSTRYGKGQNNMPTEILRKGKVPLMNTCEHYYHIDDLFNVDNNSFNLNKFNICQIRNSTTVIDKANDWKILFFKETYHIETS